MKGGLNNMKNSLLYNCSNSKNTKLLKKIVSIFYDSIIDHDNIYNNESLKETKSNYLFVNNLKSDIAITKKEFLKYSMKLFFLFNLEDFTLINALILLDQFNEIVSINQYNLINCFIASLIISMKLNEDINYEMKRLSSLSSISTNVLVNLEYNFLEIIKYDVFLNYDDMNNYIYHLQLLVN